MTPDGFILFLVFKSTWWTLGNCLLDQNLVLWACLQQPGSGENIWLKKKNKNHNKPTLQAYKGYSRHYMPNQIQIFSLEASSLSIWKKLLSRLWYFSLFFLKTFPRKFRRSVPRKLKFSLAIFEIAERNKLSFISTWGNFLSLKTDLLYWH